MYTGSKKFSGPDRKLTCYLIKFIDKLLFEHVFCRENISLQNIVFEKLLRFYATEIFPSLLPVPELFALMSNLNS